ncbi:MAG: DUF2304 domain-containing protein [Actinomycetota bacterium]
MRRLDLFVISVALVNVAVVLELVRRRQLKEKYALLWLGVGVAGILLGAGRGLVDRLATVVGVDYGPSAVFLGAIAFLGMVCMHLSWEVSRLEERTRALAEEMALMRGREERRRRPDGAVALDPPFSREG